VLYVLFETVSDLALSTLYHVVQAAKIPCYRLLSPSGEVLNEADDPNLDDAVRWVGLGWVACVCECVC
jgi:hypothetical protein